MTGLLGAAMLIMGTAQAGGASAPALDGRWELTTQYAGGSFVAGLDLRHDGDTYTGKSGYLMLDGYWYTYRGGLQKDGLHLQVSGPGGEIGQVVLRAVASGLSGEGVIHDLPVKITGHRPLQRRANAPRVHDYLPHVFYTTYSASNPPALRIFPGDTIRTQTLDAGGGGATSDQRGPQGNPVTGPFYVEGAMIGDTLVVHFDRIRPNRDTAFQQRAALNGSVLPPGYAQSPTLGWSQSWKLDRATGTATPVDPSPKLKDLRIKLAPMLGCVGVAPWWKQAIATSDLGPFGGNMDYREIREGVTVYLPVYEAGALLEIGDGHAAQADGEITGQGLETSMDVEMTVSLIKDQLLDQPWEENSDAIMVSGIGGSYNAALQNATAGISNWLRSYYGLSAAEVATVLASFIHYEVAEVTDAQTHIVAKIRKDDLAQLPKPPAPEAVFCQPGRGCR